MSVDYSMVFAPYQAQGSFFVCPHVTVELDNYLFDMYVSKSVCCPTSMEHLFCCMYSNGPFWIQHLTCIFCFQPVEATDDAFWDQFWNDTSISVQDVFALVPAAEIRAVREESPSNLATLCYKVTAFST